MNDLMEMQRLQIEALQKELEKKNAIIAKANALIAELYEVMKREQKANFDATEEEDENSLTL